VHRDRQMAETGKPEDAVEETIESDVKSLSEIDQLRQLSQPNSPTTGPISKAGKKGWGSVKADVSEGKLKPKATSMAELRKQRNLEKKSGSHRGSNTQEKPPASPQAAVPTTPDPELSPMGQTPSSPITPFHEADPGAHESSVSPRSVLMARARAKAERDSAGPEDNVGDVSNSLGVQPSLTETKSPPVDELVPGLPSLEDLNDPMSPTSPMGKQNGSCQGCLIQ